MTTNNHQTFSEWLAGLTEEALYNALRLSFITCGEYNREQDRRRLEQAHRQAESHAPTEREQERSANRAARHEARQAAANHLTEWRQRIIAGRS